MSCLPFKCRAWPHYLPRIVQSVFPACEHCDLERAVLNPVVAKMASSKWAGILVALLLTLSVATASISNDIDRRRRDEGDYERRDRHEPRGYELKGEGERERELHLEEPQEVFSSEGGDLKVWSRIRYLEDSDVFVTAARLRLRNRGLLLPKYTDVAAVAYVEEGEGLLGFLSGYNLGERVRRVRRGDVVALPRGVAHWWYNGGEEDLRILALADTTGGLRPGEYSTFFLIGGRGGEQSDKRYGSEKELGELGGILHGFSKEFLAESWNVDVSAVEELLESQKDVGIVRVEREIDVTQFPGFESHRRRMGNNVASDEMNTGPRRQIGADAPIIPADFVYNVREGTPDVRVEDAGHGNVVNRLKLPYLEYVGLGLSYAHLERDAIFAPHWAPTGHRILHILRGDGELQIVGPGGERFLNSQVREGEVYLIPRFHPAGIRAGERGLEWISFYTTDVPYIEALAGKTSVYKNLPDQVAAAAFNMDEERVREAKKSRRSHAILLPPTGERRVERRRRERDEAEGVAEFLVRYLKETFFF